MRVVEVRGSAEVVGAVATIEARVRRLPRLRGVAAVIAVASQRLRLFHLAVACGTKSGIVHEVPVHEMVVEPGLVGGGGRGPVGGDL